MMRSQIMKRRTKQAKYFIEDQPVSKKEFLKLQKQRTNEDYIQSSSLLERKIFTKSQIDKLVSMKILFPRKYKNKLYFKKEDVAKGIKSISEPPRLFPV